MDDLKFPDWKIPFQKNKKLSMDEYLEFVLFNWRNFPHGNEGDTPAPARFVIREKDEPFLKRKKKLGRGLTGEGPGV